MICSKCGAEIPDGSKFCPVCGVSFDVAAAPQYQQPQPQPQFQQAAPGYQQPVYQQPQPAVAPDGKPMRSKGIAIAALVVGILAGVFCWFVPILGPVLGIVAIILGALGIRSEAKGMAIAGLVIGIVALIVGIIVTIVWIVALSAVSTIYDGLTGGNTNLNDALDQLNDLVNQFGGN